MERTQIKNRLYELMVDNNEKPADMCRKTGIASSSLSTYLSGTRDPRQDKIQIISDVYNVNPAWLMGFDVQKQKNSPADEAKADFELLSKWHRLTLSQRKLIEGLIDECLSGFASVNG